MSIQQPEDVGHEDIQEYYQSSIIIQTIAVITTLTFLYLFSELTVPVFYVTFAHPIDAVLIAVNQYPVQLITTLVTILFVIIIHEAIHYYVAVLSGYNPEISIRKKYVFCPNQYMNRNSNLVFLMSPLLIIDAVALLLLLPVFPSILSFAAKVAFIYNTIGSASDIYNFIKVSTFPEGTVFKTIRKKGGFDVYYSTPE